MITKLDVEKIIGFYDTLPKYWAAKRSESYSVLDILTNTDSLQQVKDIEAGDAGKAGTSSIALIKTMIRAYCILYDTNKVKDDINIRIIVACSSLCDKYAAIIGKSAKKLAQENPNDPVLQIIGTLADAYNKIIKLPQVKKITNKWGVSQGTFGQQTIDYKWQYNLPAPTCVENTSNCQRDD